MDLKRFYGTLVVYAKKFIFNRIHTGAGIHQDPIIIKSKWRKGKRRDN